MKIIEALSTLKRWFDQYDIKPPRITLSWDDPRDYYHFKGEVQHQMLTQQSQLFANSGGQKFNTFMGVEIDVVQPHHCACDVCKAMRQIERQHKTNPIKL